MEEFIQNVTEQIRCVRARTDVAKELADHITDQASAYETSGLSHDEAVDKAVREMGDPVGGGVELDRIHRPQADYKMIAMFLLFSLAGLAVMCVLDDMWFYSKDIVRQSTAWFCLEDVVRQCAVVLLSFGVMAGVYFLDYTLLGRYAYLIGVLLTIAICICRIYSARWGGMPLMFMLSYLYVPVYAAVLYRLRGRGYSAVGLGIIMQFVFLFFAWKLSGTLYVALNIYMMCTALLFIAVWKKWYTVDRRIATVISAGILIVIPAGFVLVRSMLFGAGHGFQVQRILGWLYPERYANESGYIYQWIRQEWEGVKLIGASAANPFASDRMVGNPASSFAMNPFILFCIICTYGLLAGLGVVLALGAVILRAFQIVRRQKNQLGFIISAACFLVLLFNCMEGILINTGYYPVSSQQLPFVSYGGCTAVTYAALVGLLLSVCRNERVITSEAAVQRPVWRLSIKWEKR